MELQAVKDLMIEKLGIHKKYNLNPANQQFENTIYTYISLFSGDQTQREY